MSSLPAFEFVRSTSDPPPTFIEPCGYNVYQRKIIRTIEERFNNDNVISRGEMKNESLENIEC